MVKKRSKSQNSRFYTQWGVSAAILFVVVIFLVANFTIVSKESARDTVYDRVITETVLYADDIGASLENYASTVVGAASVIEAVGSVNSSNMKNYAERLEDNISDAYLVVITDSNGNGMTSRAEAIDLSKKDYFYSGTVTKYFYVNDDGITDNEAFVIAVPYRQDDLASGMVYVYVKPQVIFAGLPAKGYGGGVAFSLIKADGDIVCSSGSTSFVNKGENVFDNLASANLTDLTLSQIKLRSEKQTRMVFGASYGVEARAVTVASTGVEDWQLMIIMNRRFVDSAIDSLMSNAHKLIVELAVAICVFCILIIVMALIGRVKYGEENKDLADKADTDLLTELNNKIATERKIQEYMEDNPNSQCLMFLFDIDNFKKINDTMGHAFGDEVLRTLGHQLRNEFRVTDIIGRLGGDEFVLFLKDIKSDEQLEKEGVRITRFFQQFKAGDYVKYSATASIGGVVFPRDAKSFDEAYKAADKALYEAKRRGKNQLVFYEDYMVAGTSDKN